MSELETSSGRFDQPVRRSVRGVVKCVICSTRRSGSYLLCRQLINAGIGVPHEYFNRLHFETVCGRWGMVPRVDARYLRALYARRTTPNGVWGAKLQWRQYLAHRKLLERKVLDGSRFVFLYRDDLVSQGISLHISLVTGIWGFDGVPVSRPRPDLRMDDLEHVARCIGSIAEENRSWLRFFEQQATPPLNLRYEDVAADQPAAVRRVARFLGLADGTYSVPPPEARESRFSPDVQAARRDLAERWAATAPAGGDFAAFGDPPRVPPSTQQVSSR